jgi:cytochrome P450
VAEQCPFDLAKVNSEHDAAQAYAQWREHGSVVFAEAFGGYHAVLDYETVRMCAADTARLVSGDGATIPVLRKDARAIPAEIDPPEHRKYRKLVQGPLRPDPVRAWAGRIARRAGHRCAPRPRQQGPGSRVPAADQSAISLSAHRSTRSAASGPSRRPSVRCRRTTA